MRSLAPRPVFTPDSSDIGTMRVMGARRSMSRRLIAACGAGLALAAVSAPPALAEEPERLGYLVVEPAKGDLLTPIDIATSDVCTRGQMFAVMLDGPNLQGADRGNLIGTTKITTIGPDSYPGHYVVPLPTDLATYIATAAPGQRIRGDYTLTFACRDTLDTADLQVFTATISIDGKGRYAAQGESATPIDELIDGYVPGSAGFAYGDPAAPEPAEVAEYEAEVATAQQEAASEGPPWRVILIVVGAGLLIGAAYSWWRGRAKSTDADASDEDQPVSAGK
jgi:hypothetical protein